MTKNSLMILVGVLLCFIAIFPQCSTQLSGVETTNGCSVVATSSVIEGTAPPFSSVFIFDSCYIPYVDSGLGIGTAADERGRFRFATSAGSYNIFVMDPSGNAASIAITAPAAERGEAVSEQKQLYNPGAVSGTATGPAGDTLLVFLEGMCHYQIILADRTFLLKNVPEGTYELKVGRISGTTIGKPIEVEYGEKVTVSRDQTVSVGSIGF